MHDGLLLGLEILVDVLGCAGAVLIAVPVWQEFGLRALGSRLSSGTASAWLNEGAREAQLAVEGELVRFERSDGTYLFWGLVMIASSYVLHIATLILHAIPHAPR